MAHTFRGSNLKQNHLPCYFTFVEATETFIDLFQRDGVAEQLICWQLSGTGHAKGVHLQPGDIVEASIDGIGVLKNKMVSE